MDVKLGDKLQIYDTYVVDGESIKVRHFVGVVCAKTNDVVGLKDAFGKIQVFDLDLESYRNLTEEENNGNN